MFRHENSFDSDSFDIYVQFQSFYFAVFTTLQGNHSQSKNALYFPNFVYFRVFFPPNSLKTFPKYKGRGSFLK